MKYFTLPLLSIALLGACATLPESKTDYTLLTCEQLTAEAQIARLNIETANTSAMESLAALKHSNPYGQREGFMAAFEQGAALGKRRRAETDRSVASYSYKQIVREMSARSCSTNGGQYVQAPPSIDPAITEWVRRSTYFDKDPILTQAAVTEFGRLINRYPDVKQRDLLPLLDTYMNERFPQLAGKL